MRRILFLVLLAGAVLLSGCRSHGPNPDPHAAAPKPAPAVITDSVPAPVFVQPFTDTPITPFETVGGSNTE